LATGLTTAITKDGQTTTTARITFAQGITSSLVTDSSSVSTGSIITGGGVGIAKALYVGTTANVGGVATFSAQPIFSSLTASSAVATDASKGLVSVTNTGTGNNVLATAPTIASLNLTTALTIASASGTVGQVLTSGGSGGAPTWSSPSTTSISNGTSNVTVNSSGGTITAATAGTTAVTIDTSQNVACTGRVSGTSYTATSLNLSANGGLYLNYSTSNVASRSWQIANDVSAFGDLQIRQSTTQTGTTYSAIATFDVSGALCVGSTSPVLSSKITSSFAGNAINGATFNDTTSASGAGFCIFSIGGSSIGTITRVASTSAVAYNTTSDQRLKSNIADSQSVLDKLMSVKVRQFDWTEGQVHQDYGFIAQELEPTLSGIVTKGKTDEDMWQLDYAKLTPHLVKAIQELKAINDTQAETINAQSATLVALTARVTALENA